MTWQLGSVTLDNVFGEVRTWNELELEFRETATVVDNFIRDLQDGSGKVEIVDRATGGFNTVSIGGNQVTCEEQDRTQIRPVDTWYIDDMDEEVVGKEGGAYDVTITLVPDKEKTFDNSYGTLSQNAISETRASDEWLFEFVTGDVSTRRVTTDVTRTPDKALSGVDVTMIAVGDEVRVIEEAAAHLSSVNLRQVPDGDNIVEDRSADSRNSVTVTTPSDAQRTLPDGNYVVSDWESEWRVGSRAYMITLSMFQL